MNIISRSLLLYGTVGSELAPGAHEPWFESKNKQIKFFLNIMTAKFLNLVIIQYSRAIFTWYELKCNMS